MRSSPDLQLRKRKSQSPGTQKLQEVAGESGPGRPSPQGRLMCPQMWGQHSTLLRLPEALNTPPTPHTHQPECDPVPIVLTTPGTDTPSPFFFFLILIYLAVLCLRRRQWHPTPVILPGKSHGRRSLVGCSPWGLEESDTTERLHFHFSLSCIGGGNGNPLQCSCLENPRDGGAWWAAVSGVAQSQTQLK